jgi:hypothetical protein
LQIEASMSPGKAIAFISLAVVLVALFVVLALYRRRRSRKRSLGQDVRIWSKSDRWRPWR